MIIISQLVYESLPWLLALIDNKEKYASKDGSHNDLYEIIDVVQNLKRKRPRSQP